MFDDHILKLSADLIEKAAASGMKIAVAESCTGGLLGAAMTAVAGSSTVFERGYTTYSNEAKIQCLGVKAEQLDEFGAVSAQVASAMVKGLFKNSEAEVYCSITGIAGPGGGSEEKPVGTVYIGIGKSNIEGLENLAHHNLFTGNRDEVRYKSVETALKLMLAVV